jgi:hypothetical protein
MIWFVVTVTTIVTNELIRSILKNYTENNSRKSRHKMNPALASLRLTTLRLTTSKLTIQKLTDTDKKLTLQRVVQAVLVLLVVVVVTIGNTP